MHFNSFKIPISLHLNSFKIPLSLHFNSLKIPIFLNFNSFKNLKGYVFYVCKDRDEKTHLSLRKYYLDIDDEVISPVFNKQLVETSALETLNSIEITGT